MKDLYIKFIELSGAPTFREEWNDEYRIFFNQQYKRYGNGARGFAKKFFLRKKVQEKHPEEWTLFYQYIKRKYEVDGVGLKLIARELDISYTKTRRLLDFMGIEIRKGRNIVTENLKKVRSENAKKSGGWRDRRAKNKNTERGVQGYFFNESQNRYVWLRSTYEFIFAKWLNKNKLLWDVESQMWTLGNESYRPDFFIYDNDRLTKIVEVKGYYKNRLWKFEELKKYIHSSIELCLVDDITPFLNETTYLRELKWWKKNRLLELK